MRKEIVHGEKEKVWLGATAKHSFKIAMKGK